MLKADLHKGLNFRIEGEIGKYNTLPIEYLIKLSTNLQNLVQDIAEHQLETDGAIDLTNFKIELSGFKAGSAIPEFVFTSRVKTVTSGDVIEQRKFVNAKLQDYLEVADTGDYSKIKSLIPQARVRNIIVEDLYGLSTTFGNTPISVVNYTKSGKIIPVYKIHKFKTEVKDRLITKISDKEEEIKEEYEAVAKVKIVKRGGSIKRIPKDIFIDKHADTSFKLDTIVFNGKVYELAFPIRCKLDKEEDYFIIESEMLGIVGTGKSIEDAELNFSEDFDYIYNRYNSLSSKELSDRVRRVKMILNSIVSKIEQ